MTIIIGLVGGSGVGKDTIADHVVDRYAATKYAIAEDLKALAARIWGLAPGQLHGRGAARALKDTTDTVHGATPRNLVCRVGDAIRATYGETFQIDRIMTAIYVERPTIAVITDVRLMVEAKEIRTSGFTVKLWRVHPIAGLRTSTPGHALEKEWAVIPVDLEIYPGEGVDALACAAEEACRSTGLTARRERVTYPLCAACTGSGCDACDDNGYVEASAP